MANWTFVGIVMHSTFFIHKWVEREWERHTQRNEKIHLIFSVLSENTKSPPSSSENPLDTHFKANANDVRRLNSIFCEFSSVFCALFFFSSSPLLFAGQSLVSTNTSLSDSKANRKSNVHRVYWTADRPYLLASPLLILPVLTHSRFASLFFWPLFIWCERWRWPVRAQSVCMCQNASLIAPSLFLSRSHPSAVSFWTLRSKWQHLMWKMRARIAFWWLCFARCEISNVGSAGQHGTQRRLTVKKINSILFVFQA